MKNDANNKTTLKQIELKDEVIKNILEQNKTLLASVNKQDNGINMVFKQKDNKAVNKLLNAKDSKTEQQEVKTVNKVFKITKEQLKCDAYKQATIDANDNDLIMFIDDKNKIKFIGMVMPV